ncbi:protein of unknown function (plasmid) [Agrobacterium pusense]|uniref:Uncharacterized protein n=1 Tax=Agrobacterium pusense TaxID=648995 RepID=U4QIM6_9HYPH|nr:protein of unknown function [Agrobacterium pusense]
MRRRDQFGLPEFSQAKSRAVTTIYQGIADEHGSSHGVTPLCVRSAWVFAEQAHAVLEFSRDTAIHEFQRVSAKTCLTEPGLAPLRNFAMVLTIHKIAAPRSLRLC